jgi:hypothetical protein
VFALGGGRCERHCAGLAFIVEALIMHALALFFLLKRFMVTVCFVRQANRRHACWCPSMHLRVEQCHKL